MKAASMGSKRLKRVLSVLKRGSATTRTIIRDANVCAVSAIISELRENGYRITCKPLSKKRYLYTLLA